MGADIHGHVECRATFGFADDFDDEYTCWEAAVDLDFLYAGRSYTAFGCLFGVRNHAGFRPLAEGRGLPADVAAETRRPYDEWAGAHSATWIGRPELADADWDERAPEPPMTRREAVPDDWEPVWTVMRTLAGLHGGENVRLVVWFDN
jgi:hypothetical protein